MLRKADVRLGQEIDTYEKKRKKQQEEYEKQQANQPTGIKGYFKNLVNTDKLKEISSDGFQAKDILDYGKLAAKTGVEGVKSIGRGILSTGENIGDYAAYHTANALQKAGIAEDYMEEVKRATTDNLNRKILAPTNDSLLGTSGQSTLEGVGNSLSNMAIGGVLGTGATYGSMFLSSAGGATTNKYAEIDKTLQQLQFQKQLATGEEKERLQAEIDDLSKNKDKYINTYATISGLAEMGSEAMFGGIAKGLKIRGIGTGAEDDLIRYATKNISNMLARNLISAGISATGEGIEEIMSDFGEALAEKASTEKDKSFTELLADKDWLGDFMNGFMSSLLTQGGETIKASRSGIDITTGLTQTESDVVKELAKEQQAKDGGKLSDIERDIENKLKEGTIKYEDIQRVLSKDTYNELDSLRQKQNRIGELQKRIDELDKNPNEKLTSLNEYNSTKEELNRLQNEDYSRIDELTERLENETNELTKGKDGNMSGAFAQSYLDRQNRGVAYQVDEDTYNKASKELQGLYDSARRIMNNTVQSRKFIDSMAKLSKSNGLNYQMTNNQELKELGKTVDGKVVNGLGYRTENGNTILINVDAADNLNTILGHETTHFTETAGNYKDYQKFLQKNFKDEYNALKEKYESIYEGLDADIDSEITAQLTGEKLFNDSDFIQKLTEKPTLFNKIKNFIDDLVTKFTGTKEEKQLKDLQKRFQEVYDKTDFKKNIEQKNSLTEDSQGRELTKQQQEYFKDSKVRDEDGRLLEVYHGTNNNFNVFKSDYNEYYFTDNENASKDYGYITKREYLNLINPYVVDFEGRNDKANELYENGVFDVIDYAKENGYDGVIVKNTYDGANTHNQYVAFNPNQIKNVDNLNPTSNEDIRYSLSVQEANTTQDNEGRKLTDNQLAYFKDSKAVDENGNLVTVYHTMTNTGSQFFEFNPVGTDFYRFGNQVVNYFTDNQDMSGSYADSNYKRAYTKPIKSMEDVQDFIKFQNTQNDSKIGVNGITSHYSIEKNGNGFTLKQTPSGKEFLGYDNLSEEGKVALNRLRANERVQKEFERSSNPIVVITDTLKGWDIVREYKGYPELAELVELYDREAQKLIATGTTYEEQMVIREVLKNDLENYLFGTQEYSDEKVNEVIERSLTKQFENEQDLIDNIQNNFQAKYQYAGYINMTNPYVIDTFGENWDSVTTERNEAKSSEYNRVVKDNETKEKLYNLAQESERLFKEYSQSNKPREFAEYSIIKNKINNSELREVVNDMGMFGLTYEGWLEAGKKNAELFGEEYKQTLPNSDEKISNYTESLNPAEQELVQDLTIGEFVNRYGELYKENMKFGDSSSYFKDQFRTTTGTTLDTDKIGYSNMFDLARYNFDGSSVSEFLDEKLTTNDLVKRIIEKNNSGETNYDGLIMKNVYDYGGKSNKSYRTTGDLYVTFNSNQFKAVDNTNPTSNPDIRYSLSEGNFTTGQDSDGRKLSESQNEFFKNSKVTDGNGNLQVLYNGSGNHTVYLPGYMSDESLWGKGIYLTPFREVAENYGSDIKEVYVDIKNPLTSGKTITFEQYNNLYKAINEGEEAYREEYDMYNDDFDLLWDLVNKGSWADYADEIIKYTGKDGIIVNNPDAEMADQMVIAFRSNQIKNVDNLTPTEDPDIRYSLQNQNEQLAPYNPNGIYGQDVRLENQQVREDIDTLRDIAPIRTNIDEEGDTILNADIERDIAPTSLVVDTQPVPEGKGRSSYWQNVGKQDFLTDESKELIQDEDDVKYYDVVSNKETLSKAYDKLRTGGTSEVLNWNNKFQLDEKGKVKSKVTAEDVAEGWILMKQYQNDGNYDAMIQVAKTMRNMGTEAGQAVQAFNIMSRMTPEGMVKYAQSELTEAFDKASKNKSKQWIDMNEGNFDLTPDETRYIIDTMNEVQNMEDGYEKKVKLAQIQALISNKLPTNLGNEIKSWMRISMLFNPKTQVRNVAGNAVIVPVNAAADVFSSAIDRFLARKTGVRTTGTFNVKAALEGLKRGAYEATNDYKLGINTKDVNMDRFEAGQGKSFTEKTILGKTLNNTESLLNYVMDLGDRVFSEAVFENSLQNQMELNNTTEITQDMIDIARTEALQRTWNDNNNYTKFVLDIRKALNKANFKGYGLGDVLIPFAKTPANLTKAIVDYSPVGLVNSLVKGKNLKNAIETGKFTAQQQHEFVQTLGKATAGTLLYVLGYALAKAGISTGKSDDDKDVSNFMKNTLGISSYSINVGGKSYTYDWAQPIAAPFSITANIVSSKNNEEALAESIVANLDTAGSILMEQSFLQSLNETLNNNDGVVNGLLQQALELPARAIPTLSKQIADLTDDTQRQTYEYNEPIKTAINKMKSKIPGLSEDLAPVVDTMGREVKKYGGKNTLFNVFLNPANVNTENISSSAKEIYDLYKSTGDKTIMPRTAPYYVNKKGEKIVLNSTQKAEYQRISGSMIESQVQDLMNNTQYINMSDEEKASIVKKIVDYSYNIAQHDVLGTEISQTYQTAYLYSKVGNVNDWYLLKSQEFTSDKNSEGKTISGSLKNKVVNYVNEMDISAIDKVMLIELNGYRLSDYDMEVYNYINSMDLSYDDKLALLKKMGVIQ